MKNLLFLITLATVTGCLLAGCPALPVAAGSHSTLPGPAQARASHPNGYLAGPIDAPNPSCADPMPDEIKECHELEEQILASTVRIEWNLWVKEKDGNGYSRVDRIAHATVKQGRYLVTHNHGQVLRSDLKNKEFNKVSLFRADGTLIWPKGPLNTITISVEDQETLVLDFGDYGGQGLFTTLGVSSAEFKAWESLSLRPGVEVAQIVWDGATAYVNWVTIDGISTENNTPRLELDSLVTLGTSGGGVFWNGYHVANTRSQVVAYDEKSGAVLRQFSVAALNSPQVAAQLP